MKNKLLLSLLNEWLVLFLAAEIFAQSPFKTDTETEAILLASSAGIMLASEMVWDSIQPITEDEISRLSKFDINSFDRWAVNPYSAKISRASDALLGVCALAPLILFTEEKIRSDYFVNGLMYGETLVATYFLTNLIKSNGRLRPFLYDPAVPVTKKLTWGKDAKASFPSGHTSLAFASAVLFSTIYSDYFPESKYRPLVWTSSLLLASSVGYLRLAAGVHFPTDIVAASAIGSLVGIFIPYLHRNNNAKETSNNWSYQINPVQIRIVYHF